MAFYQSEQAARILAFLDAHHVMSLATCGIEGPHAANLFYARDEFALLWVSEPSSQHSIHIERQSRVAATIAKDYSDYSQISGLQIVGKARRVMDESECARFRHQLEQRLPFLQVINGAVMQLRQAYGRVEFYRLEPLRIVLIDNARGFGFKEAIDFRSEGA